MKYTILLTLLIDVARGEVSGYLGDTITLPSQADPGWNLSSIVWSIFSNNTWIATYHNGMKNVKWVDRYKGRLNLNTASGYLTIHNLTIEDSMEYTVDLINTEGQNDGHKTKLTVRPHLQKPTIKTVIHEFVNRSCWLWLHCSSAEKGVDLSWQIEPSSMTFMNMSNPSGNSAVLFAFLNTTQKGLKLTCTSSKNMENASSVVTPKCNDNEPQPTPQSKAGSAGAFFGGVIVGLILTGVISYFFGEQIKAKCRDLKGKLSPPKENSGA